MKEKKIRILLLASDLAGVGHFRSIWPAQSINKNFSDEFEVDVSTIAENFEYNYLKSFDIIHFHRVLLTYERMEELTARLSKDGVILVMDIDDYWEPPSTHPLYEIAKSEKLGEKIVKNFSMVNYVTTTTNIFKKYIQKFNPSVEIIPNALDMNHKMWNSELAENKNNYCRISWIGGSSHLYDLKLLENSMNRLNGSEELRGKYQIIMCGYDTRGSVTEMSPNGERRTRKILPHETIWNNFESVFTSNYNLLHDDKEYVDWLKKIKREPYPGEYEKKYVRRWTLPLTQYGKHYDYCDVCLAPLIQNEYVKDAKGTISKKPHFFNEVKSELKIIEAGMKKKVLIAQDYAIYKELLKDGETALLVSDNKDGWYKAMKKIILDKDYREQLANNLHEYIKERYELKKATEQRVSFYKKAIKEKETGNMPSRPIDWKEVVKKTEQSTIFQTNRNTGIVNQSLMDGFVKDYLKKTEDK